MKARQLAFQATDEVRIMSLDSLRLMVKEIIGQLTRGEYESVVRRCVKSRLTSDELRRVVLDYGRTLVLPPGDAFNKLDAVRVEATHVPTWSIRAPVWTQEEGRSDLTLELTIAIGPGNPNIELDDFHVL